MKNTQERIQFSVGPCELGLVFVAFSEKGLCAIFFGDEVESLKKDLQKRLPKAILADASDLTTLNEVCSIMKEFNKELTIPLDERGTPFQLRVWKALREIPVGRTASYSEIAQKIGSPNSIRAVGAACGANPLSLVTPCHRALRKDGHLCGYYWGLERKQKLLDLERAFISLGN